MKALFYLVLIPIICISCTHKTNQQEIQEYTEQLVQDPFDLSGAYHWNFQLMGGTQKSVHTLYPDSIAYRMDGKVYSTVYTMQKLSYERAQKKWIGQDQEGIVYVLFFKELTDSSLTIYKHKCKDEGLAEALAFELPPADATNDHGWNVYALSVDDKEDELPLSGSYKDGDQTLILTDQLVTYNGNDYHKMSYHAGERRWVGQTKPRTLSEGIYLQLFFEDLSSSGYLDISAREFSDLEEAYQTKYHTSEFQRFQKQ